MQETANPNAQVTYRRTLRLYKPHPGQLAAHNLRTRFNVNCWGRQSGKTTYGLNKVANKAWVGPKNGMYWYILQTYDAADVAFKRFYRLYKSSPRAFDRKPNESDLWGRFRHGPEIHFKSGNNFEDLRIETLHGVVIDEYRQQHQDLWPIVIRPMLSHYKGWADILSTPNGFDHFYDLFEAAKLNPEWGWLHHPSTIAPWWTEEEVRSAAATMSEAQFAQEILAEFRDLTKGRVYPVYNASIHEHAENPFAAGRRYSQFLPIVVGLDFNINHMAWELGQMRAGKWYWADEIFIPGDTVSVAKALVEKVRGHTPGVLLIGDASGNARQRAAGGKSDYDVLIQVLKDNHIKWENQTPEANPGVKDRVNAVNAKWKSADGQVHMWHHPACKQLKKDSQRVVWKATDVADMEKKKDPSLTHASDAIGYPIHELTPVPSHHKVGILSVITR